MNDHPVGDDETTADVLAETSATVGQGANDAPTDPVEDVPEDTLGNASEGLTTERLAEDDERLSEGVSRDSGSLESSSDEDEAIPEDLPSDLPQGSTDAIAQGANLDSEDASSEVDEDVPQPSPSQGGEDEDVQAEVDRLADRVNVENLPDFEPETWDRLSLDGKRDSIETFAGYNADILGLDHKPSTEYYQSDDPGDYGRFNNQTNSLEINESNLSDGLEAADTVAHESRHAYQYQHAQNPESEQDFRFRDNFDDYISPEQDFAGYKDQILESDARDHAQQIVRPRNS